MVYCGKDCQTTHWRHHKKLCKAIKKGSAEPTVEHAAAAFAAAQPTKRVLLVTGLGCLGPNDFWIKGHDESNLLGLSLVLQRAGLRVTVCDASAPSDPFEQIGAMLALGLFDCCVVLQVHSGGFDADFFTSVSFRRNLLSWVSGGGTVLFHGERNVV